jgi:tetratricopeptide (TPR) repeat protein
LLYYIWQLKSLIISAALVPRVFLASLLFFTFTKGHGQKKSKRGQERDTILFMQEHLVDMLDKSFHLYDQGNFRESLENNLATIKLTEQYNDFYAAHDSYSYLGYNYLVLEDTLKALESFKKAHHYARKTREPPINCKLLYRFCISLCAG